MFMNPLIGCCLALLVCLLGVAHAAAAEHKRVLNGKTLLRRMSPVLALADIDGLPMARLAGKF
jgi:hypothetical protein